jgi:hypothetical protein
MLTVSALLVLAACRLSALPDDYSRKKVAVNAEFFRVSHEEGGDMMRAARREAWVGACECAPSTHNRARCCFASVLVAAVCLQRLRTLLGIVLPSMRCKEFFILCLHTLFLVSRTLVSIYVAQLDGSIVKSIVDRKLKLFLFLMCKWMAIAVPATYINSMIMYLESKLSIAFRTRLVKYVYEMYDHTLHTAATSRSRAPLTEENGRRKNG